MKPKLFLLSIAFLLLTQINYAQVFYVDSQNGSDMNSGAINMPFKTIQKAIEVSNKLTGKGDITIKVMPGVYLLQDKVSINPVRILDKLDRYTIEAVTMPDDSSWTPEKMPVIQSVSNNNSITQMPHAVGLLVSTDNVTVHGLKFIGNPNPSVSRYYPITRENPDLKSLEVSQCYFIAEKNSSPIQGGIWAHGQETNVDHCIFYNCRNGILLLGGVKNCSVTNSIILGAYQSAIWVGVEDPGFVFNRNIISNCNYFWIKLAFNKETYQFNDCVIVNNDHYTGINKNRQLHETTEKYVENNVIKSGELRLVEKSDESLPFNYLHPAPGTLGYNLDVGIFKKKMNKQGA